VVWGEQKVEKTHIKG
jgi:hypothetical protein